MVLQHTFIKLNACCCLFRTGVLFRSDSREHFMHPTRLLKWSWMPDSVQESPVFQEESPVVGVRVCAVL